MPSLQKSSQADVDPMLYLFDHRCSVSVEKSHLSHASLRQSTDMCVWADTGQYQQHSRDRTADATNKRQRSQKSSRIDGLCTRVASPFRCLIMIKFYNGDSIFHFELHLKNDYRTMSPVIHGLLLNERLASWVRESTSLCPKDAVVSLNCQTSFH